MARIGYSFSSRSHHYRFSPHTRLQHSLQCRDVSPGYSHSHQQDIQLTNITNLHSGRAIVAKYKGIHLINIYAPSGTAKRTEREHFYNTELPYLLYTGPKNLLIGGDFNFVLHAADTTGQCHSSRTIKEMIQGLHLQDAWNQNPTNPTYTHFFPTGATRKDRFYMAPKMMERKTGIQVLPVAFTDHEAVVLRITSTESNIHRPRIRWKMNPLPMSDDGFQQQVGTDWTRWRTYKSHYPDITDWWEWYIKRRLQNLIRKEQSERSKDFKQTENH
jgi:hypothetical protein